MQILLSFIALVFVGNLAAQDCTLTLSAKKAGWAPDTTVEVDSLGDTLAVTSIGMPKSGSVSIAVSQADSTCEVTDANGMDGSAAATIPEGDYSVIARASGKKGGSFTVGDVLLGRQKGKPKWAEVALSGDSWDVINASGEHLQLRVLALVPEP